MNVDFARTRDENAPISTDLRVLTSVITTLIRDLGCITRDESCYQRKRVGELHRAERDKRQHMLDAYRFFFSDECEEILDRIGIAPDAMRDALRGEHRGISISVGDGEYASLITRCRENIRQIEEGSSVVSLLKRDAQ